MLEEIHRALRLPLVADDRNCPLYTCLFSCLLKENTHSGVWCPLLKHTPHNSKRLVNDLVFEAQSERLDDDGRVLADVGSMASTFRSAPNYNPKEFVPMSGEIITFITGPLVFHTGLLFWLSLLALFVEGIFFVFMLPL